MEAVGSDLSETPSSFQTARVIAELDNVLTLGPPDLARVILVERVVPDDVPATDPWIEDAQSRAIHRGRRRALGPDIEIGLSVVFDRPDTEAPVSTLLYDGRKQDLAFEKPVGESADQRHHVRFWRTKPAADDPRPLWLGAASFDRGVGLSHDTGQITHHIGPDLDAERDNLMRDLENAGQLQSTYEIPGSGATTTGRNGGGDPFFTDGEAWWRPAA